MIKKQTNETMKVTAKNYIEQYENRKNINNQIDNAKYSNNWELAHNLTEELKKFELFFNSLNTVYVSYSIGGRSYYESAVKIGNKYFKYGNAMTKGRGYYNLLEIDEITEEQTNSMIADSYYY